MHIYRITDAGIDKLKLYKELYGEKNPYIGIIYVNGMNLMLNEKDRTLTLSYEVDHEFYLGLHHLLKGDLLETGSNSITFCGDKQ